jgi:hypothetical protein
MNILKRQSELICRSSKAIRTSGGERDTYGEGEVKQPVENE